MKKEMKILVVDDDPASRRILGEILSPYGVCDYCEDGREALLQFQAHLEQQHPYHLVLLDIMIPQLDGKLLLKEMREAEERLGRGSSGDEAAHIVMITGCSDATNITKSYRYGADGYLVKPLSREQLVATLKNLPRISDA